MPKTGDYVLYEREGEDPEVGKYDEPDMVVLIDGTILDVDHGDYLDVIDVNTQYWERSGLLSLNKGLRNRTMRRIAQLK